MHQNSLFAAIAALITLVGQPMAARAQTESLPSETPPSFVETFAGFDFTRRDVMIAMRDGVKLHTVILVPKGARNAPLLLTRTPYNASELTSHTPSTHLEAVLKGYDNAADVIVQGGYIRVVQDVRGKYGSEGDYVMNRPLRGPLNPTAVDHATDSYDTIDWLVKNLPESNGKVGIIGISYDGFTPLMALVNPHPALKVAVPMNPMVDGWIGDDWFHHGAFRQQGSADYIYEQEATRGNSVKWTSPYYDDYDLFLKAGSAGELGRSTGLDQLGFWRKLTLHPAYDSFWQEQAMDRVLEALPLTVPVLLVHSLFDQEDIYGALAVYKALKPKDRAGDKVFLAFGPWRHGGEIGDGSSLGALKFDQDTGKWFRRQVLAPFLAHFLADDAPRLTLAPVTAFETGSNVWRRLDRWPLASSDPARLYLHAGFKAGFAPPGATEPRGDAYLSDPAKPVTYRQRPIRPVPAPDSTWHNWLVDDQRFAAVRPDVLSYTSDPLSAPLRLAGEPIADMAVSTSGSDGDLVVKLIDQYPDEYPDQPEMGGYQLAVAMDILRGRYRQNFSNAQPIVANKPLRWRFALPNVNHVFLPGHRILLQIQSSWFPLYDRNPQTFVPNIFFAKPDDYKPATVTLWHAPDLASFVELPVVTEP
jgi:putative CocE/NonD family hydrolase